jgi:hypothetical protein
VQKSRQAKGSTHGDHYARGERHGASTHPESFVGSGNGRARLNEDAGAEIRRLRATGVPYRRLSSLYATPFSTIAKIIQRVTWKHVA